jgi:hypothetical protein
MMTLKQRKAARAEKKLDARFGKPVMLNKGDRVFYAGIGWYYVTIVLGHTGITDGRTFIVQGPNGTMFFTCSAELHRSKEDALADIPITAVVHRLEATR